MNPQEELERLRREVDTWRVQGELLARRVAELEARAAAPVAPDPAAPRSLPAGPPPLPKGVAASPPPSPAAPTLAPGADATPSPGPAAPTPPPGPEAPAPTLVGDAVPVSGLDATTGTPEADAAIPAAPKAPAPRPVFVEGPSLAERLGALLRRLGPAEEMSWEMALGSYWLPRAAMVLLAVGVVWLLGLGINRFAGAWWMPHARLALGYALCAGLLLWGWRQRVPTPGFARVLLGGGIGLSYFVTFATHFIPFSRVFPRPEPTLLLLAGLSLAWLGVAQTRRAPWLALGVVLMGQGTVALSTLTLVVPSAWAVAGLLGLAAAGAWFHVRNGWFAVAAASLAGSYANHFFWMTQSPGSDRMLDFGIGMAVLAIYGAVFAWADWRAPAAHRAAVALRWRTAYAAANAGAVLALGTGLMQAFAFSAPRLHLFLLALCAALAGLALLYRRGGPGDPMAQAYFTKASLVFTLGLAAWLDGASLTLSLALEALALLLAAQRTGSPVARLLALGALLLTLGHGLPGALDLPRLAPGDAGYPGRAFATAGIALALAAFAVRWQRAAWQSPNAGSLPAPLRALFFWIDSGPAPAPGPQRPVQGLLVPELAAWGAAALLLLQLNTLLSTALAPVAMLAALALVAGAVAFGARPLAHASWLLAGFAWAAWHLNGLPAYVLPYASGDYALRVAQAAAIWAPLLAMSECARRAAPASWSRHPQVVSALPLIYAALAAEAYTAMGAVFFHPNHAPLLLGLSLLAALAYARGAGASGFAVFAGVLAVVTARMLAWADYNDVPLLWGLAGTLALVAAVPAADPRAAGTGPGLCLLQHPLGRYLLPGAAVWAVVCAALAYAPAGWAPLPLLLAGAAAALAMRVLSGDPLGWAATALGMAALVAWFDVAPRDFPLAWHLQAGLLFAGLLAADRWFARRALYPRRVPGALAVAGAWTAALVYIVRYWSDENAMYLLVLVGGFFLAYGAWCRGRTPVLLGALAAAMGTVLTVVLSHDEPMGTGDLVLNYGAAVAFWFVWERGFARFTGDAAPRSPLNQTVLALFTAVPCLLLVAFVERLPFVGGAYLSIGWTLAALAMLGAGAATGHAHYRYAGLITFAVVLYRIVVIDSRGLDAVYRIAGMIFLGLVLLGVGYAYVRSRERAGGPGQ